MHIAFFVYGKRDLVEDFYRELESKPYIFPFYKGKKKRELIWRPQIRIAPFGVTEYIIPKEYMVEVMTMLGFKRCHYTISKVKMFALRKALGYDPIPDVS